MLKGRGRATLPVAPAPAQVAVRPASGPPRTPLPARPAARPEPDYEVVEFPSDQYVNAKLQPPPPPPPRPPTGHPVAAGASCGLCGGGGARVRCAECGRRALCASCDDMYHRHPKRRHHQRQALSPSQLSEDRPPLPPKTVAPPVPPPRRHKLSASPRPPMVQDQRHATLGHSPMMRPQNFGPPGNFAQPQPNFGQPQPNFGQLQPNFGQPQQTFGQPQQTFGQSPSPSFNQQQHLPVHVQAKMMPSPQHVGSMPFLNTMPHPTAQAHPQAQSNTLGHNMNTAWNKPRGSLQGFNMPQMASSEAWESPSPGSMQNQWGRPLRRGASVLELGGGAAPCGGCGQCNPSAWRYGSCASLDHPWAAQGWPAPAPACCHHSHLSPHTPQPYRRADSRTMSRAASRAGSRAASPAHSIRSRTSRRTKHRTPSPQPLPSSDADSESESEEEPAPARRGSRSSGVGARNHISRDVQRDANRREEAPQAMSPREPAPREPLPREPVAPEASPVEAPVPPPAPAAPWHCEHCTYVNEPGVRVCAVCCRTPTAPPRVADITAQMDALDIGKSEVRTSPPRARESPRVEVGAEIPKRSDSFKSTKERKSTGCGPSPPREQRRPVEPTGRLVTPTREQNGSVKSEQHSRHDMGVGPSPPRDRAAAHTSPLREANKTVRVSPYRETKEVVKAPVQRHSVSVGPSPPRHSVSVGPSPPREATRHNISVGPSPPRSVSSNSNFPKKSAGTSPPPGGPAAQAGQAGQAGRGSTTSSPAPTTRTSTGTSPPPQTISTQTYEESPRDWERGSVSGSTRSRRRTRDEPRRERSRSRHSLSSDTRVSNTTESERSVRTAGGGWEWRGRESSPGAWGLHRRASHLDLRRARTQRRASFYGSEATSPEPRAARAASVEALAGRRGLELARLLADADKLGYDAAEVQVALSASPVAPLEWLRSRWAGLVGAVCGAAARLAPHAPLSERDARAALARHRGAVWPAVTECVDALRGQKAQPRVSSAARVRGRVWGAGAGADDEAAPRAEYYSSDEWDGLRADEDAWGPPPEPDYELGPDLRRDSWDEPPDARALLADLLLAPGLPYDLIQSENDFIDAYNALTRATPLPNVVDVQLPARPDHLDHDHSRRADDERNGTRVNKQINKTREHESTRDARNNKTNGKDLKATSPEIYLNTKQEPKKAKIKIIKSENQIDSEKKTNGIEIATPSNSADNNRKELKSPTEPLLSPHIMHGEEKASNLNDIVDDTQRLIQQMKDEINSDITSLDEGHAHTSSEHESSSHDEREESSYSDSEATDNISSDEGEHSGEEEYEEEEIEEAPQNINTFPNRASSEDNEQFEEALDNLDHQIEDVKNANFEILDSIARSLQEEHTIVVEINEPMEEVIDIQEETVIVKEQIIEPKSVPKKEDANNNKLFLPVNSFDEIYAELSTSTNSINSEIQQSEPAEPPRIAVVSESPPIEPKVLHTKHTINEIVVQIETPIKALISERIEPIFNATIETIEVPNESEKEIQSINDVVEVNPTEVVEIEENHQNVTNVRAKSSSPSESESDPSQNSDIVDITNSTESKTTVEQVEITIEGLAPLAEPEDENDEILEPIQNQNDQQRNSLEKQVGSVKNDNNVTKLVTVKSNIPKPIKPAPSIKAKVDKLAPKLLVSKVPVRRASQKQYPAPAPPKAHFGNVQSGHVKQLQSKVFNEKPAPAPAQIPVTVDVKPSTSTATLTKKKPAPQPPAKPERASQAKRVSPPQASPPKAKRNYFRETCRTEDEWTDSDSDDSQAQVVRPAAIKEEEPQAPPSPPPPPTLRRVSGQLIDLASVQVPEGSPERQARMLLAAGALETWEQARLAVELVSRGAAPAPALLAALECADLPAALAYLHQDCELCAMHSLPEHEMVTMLSCTHRCCRECARLYFTVQVTERGIADCVCPFCKLPELETLPEDAWLDYFAHLDILLKGLLEPPIHELFQRKLRDRTLARDPNFKWCVECSSGFFVHPKQKKLRCPECRSVTCASCRKPWSSNHEGLSCAQYAAWLEDNDPDRSAAAIQQHLRDNGLECPRCRFKYSLSRGGCMHFTCTQCKFEFCFGCGKPFTMGARCGLSEYCAKLGLHAHHPRNCLFYLRDKEPHELQTLLQMNNIEFEKAAPDGSTGRCPVQLQRETPAGLVDGVCGSEAPDNYAGLCKLHYVEYLAGLARATDPIPIMDVPELVAELRRRALPLPERGPWDTDPIYAGMCAEIVKEKIPLD